MYSCVPIGVWPHTNTQTHKHTWGMVGYCPTQPVGTTTPVTRKLKPQTQVGQGRCSAHIHTRTRAGCPHVSSMCRRHACWCACVITPAAIYVRGRGGWSMEGRSRDSGVCCGGRGRGAAGVHFGVGGGGIAPNVVGGWKGYGQGPTSPASPQWTTPRPPPAPHSK